jgi:hypothetical protein
MARNIVLCCDGTANEFANDRTNVVKLYYSLAQDPAQQIVSYHPGLGTMEPPGALTGVTKKLARLAGLAFGAGLERDICRGEEAMNRVTLGGFPWHCLDGCMTPSDCIMVGCLKLYLKDGLSKYAGQENTPALRKQMAADMVDLYRAYGEKKR